MFDIHLKKKDFLSEILSIKKNVKHTLNKTDTNIHILREKHAIVKQTFLQKVEIEPYKGDFRHLE